MKTYGLMKLPDGILQNVVRRLIDGACIPFDPANTDYQLFKEEIAEETAELKDADGNVMTAEEAKQFIATLP